MALNARQQALYTDTVTIFRPVASNTLTEIGTIKEPLFERLAENVLCKLDPNKDTTTLGMAGRFQNPAKDELEKFYFEAYTDVRENDVLELTTPDHPFAGRYYVCVGEPEVRITYGVRTAGYLHIQVRTRSIPPQVIP
jgi:hypothetical protein